MPSLCTLSRPFCALQSHAELPLLALSPSGPSLRWPHGVLRQSRAYAAGPSDAEAASDDEDEEDDEFAFSDGDDMEEDAVGMEITTGGTEWGEAALATAQSLVAADATLALYSLRAAPRSKRLDVRIDKLTNKFGSPSLDEVTQFSRAMGEALEAALGAEAAGEIEVEVSSPGAERVVRVPEDLERFAELPMAVEWEDSGDGGGAEAKVLQFVSYSAEDGVTRWRLANVRANRVGKGRPLNKKQRETVIEIPTAAVRSANLHVDI